jgi:hypothetical protein
LTNWAGCHYVDPPKAFDPEIEGLPDWMGAKGEKEGRLWSGVDRVVEVPGEKKIASLEDEWKGLRKRRGDGEKEEWVEEGGLVDLDDGKGEEGEGDIEKGERIFNTVPHMPTGAERTSSSPWTSIQTPTPMLPTTTSSLAPAPTSTAMPMAAASLLAQRNGWHSSIGPAVLFTTIAISFLIALAWLAFWAKKFWNKLAKRSNERYQEESRRRCEDIVARQAGIELKDVNVGEGRAENRAEANVQEERWQDVTLR